MHYDVLIVGGGVAGLYAALKLAPLKVAVVTASPLGVGAATGWAQGGIAAALGADDTPALHAADTIAAGHGLVDETIAHMVAEAAPRVIADLVDLGVPFDRDGKGQIALGREGAHGCARIVHAHGDGTGAALMDVLIKRIKDASHVAVFSPFLIECLLFDGAKQVAGARFQSSAGAQDFFAPFVMLATGGLGGLYAVTTNPRSALGCGLAVAAQAGAQIKHAEFVQFHPTALDVGIDPAPLISEAVRGDGALLLNSRLERFVDELAPRDVVARAIFSAQQSGAVYLDARSVTNLLERFPNLLAASAQAGLDPLRDLLPVAPAAHYHMGGVAVDGVGQSTARGLFALGEVACTGLHGANRLASNSLLEALVFAERAGAHVLNHYSGCSSVDAVLPLADPLVEEQPHFMPALRRTMSDLVGPVRTRDGLQSAFDFMQSYLGNPSLSFVQRQALLAARLVVEGALGRPESCGAHHMVETEHSAIFESSYTGALA